MIPHYLVNLAFHEKRNILLEMILKNVSIGDTETLHTHLNTVCLICDELPLPSAFEELKHFLYELNVLLRHLSHTHKVHAQYCEETYQSFYQQLHSVTLYSALKKILLAMADSYLCLIRDSSRRQYSNLIRACLDYIDFHFPEPITLTSEASRLSVSESYLSSRFTEETGQNFITYVNTIRIRYACTLLEKLQLSIQRIAELCGFSSSNYFARVFRQQMGITPTEYRKQIQATHK